MKNKVGNLFFIISISVKRLLKIKKESFAIIMLFYCVGRKEYILKNRK